jgi:hypothetical protein
MSFSAAVSFLVVPKSARRLVKGDLVEITDLQESILTAITRSFLSGSEDDFNDIAFEEAQVSYKTVFGSLVNNLREAKFEHYVLGTEKVHHIEVKLVKCLERISQSLAGLRSAATTQFSLIDKSRSDLDPAFDLNAPQASSPQPESDFTKLSRSFSGSVQALEPIEEVLEPSSSLESSRAPSIAPNSADIFSLFIRELGPPMVSFITPKPN